MKPFISVLIVGFVIIFYQTVSAKVISGKDISYDNLPLEKEGKFPIAIPKYEGQIKQLLPISSKHLIVAIWNISELVAKMDELSGGQLVKAVKDFQESEKNGKPNWTLYKLPRKIWETHLAEARELIGERKFEDTQFFTISSNDDERFKDGIKPVKVTKTYAFLGGSRIPGAHDVDYAHYCFLELPFPLKNNCNYTISAGNVGKTEFLYDEMRTVSRAIKINQAGYLPDAGAKFAYLGACGYEFGPIDFSFADKFNVVDVSTGNIVYSGKINLKEKNPLFEIPPGKDEKKGAKQEMYGEDVYEIDLSGLNQEGNFFISIPAVGRSWTFRHANDAYGEAFYTACRGLFHQRAAFALEQPFTAWTRPKSKMHDTIYESENISFPIHSGGPKNYSHFDVIGATTDKTKKTENVTGGWYDAADWDRNEHHYVCVFDLLEAFETAPEKFSDAQLNIPESGNGVPDILDEAVYGLECWKKSQTPDGGVSGYIETWTHPDYDFPDALYTFSRRTRWNSLVFAAAASQYSRLVRPFDPKSADIYANASKKAYEFGNNLANSLGKVTINAKYNRGKGEAYTFEWEETDDSIYPYLVHAKIQMFKMTSDKTYLNDIEELSKKAHAPFDWKFSHRDFSAWIMAGIPFHGKGLISDETLNKWRDFYVKNADTLVSHIEKNPYRQTWPRYQNYWAGWGASCVTNFNRCLAIAYRLTGDKKYRDAIINNADFMLGANPMGMSWTTGIGYVYPIDIQHANSEDDMIMDPIPGITIYGITGGPGAHYQGRDLVWESKGADGQKISFINKKNKKVPFYRSWSCHPSTNTGQCEFTIHETMSSTIFTCATLLNKGWMPNENLKKKNPRKDNYLFGYWYLQ